MWGTGILALLGVAGSVAAAMAAEPSRPAANGAKSESKADEFEIKFEGSWASDYVYRGVTLSGRQPSLGVAIEATRGPFYLGVDVNGVRLPTHPDSEVTVSTGIRKTIWDFDFDLGASYFYYPHEITPPGTPVSNYWEALLDVKRKLMPGLTFDGQLAYSPSVANTGARGLYTYTSLEVDLPQFGTLEDLAWSFSAGVGYWRFGTVSPELGGFALPRYTHWDAGLTFTYLKTFELDLRYTDTSLSKEDCFVFTGDPGAMPGGAIDPIRNPNGLRSNFCGAALVGKLTVKYPPSDD
jgi:uncharacterized protein (TIGR02001 family)